MYSPAVSVADLHAFAVSIDPCTIICSCLPPVVGDAELAKIFAPFGEVVSAHVQVHPATGAHSGCGYVKFCAASAAANAVRSMNGLAIDGHLLVVSYAQAHPVAVQPNTLVSFPPAGSMRYASELAMPHHGGTVVAPAGYALMPLSYFTSPSAPHPLPFVAPSNAEKLFGQSPTKSLAVTDDDDRSTASAATTAAVRW